MPIRLPATRPRCVDAQFRVVIPPEVRPVLGVKPRSHVSFEAEGGHVRIFKVNWQGDDDDDRDDDDG